MPSADTIKPRALPRGHDSADADAAHQGLLELKHHLVETKGKMNGAINGHSLSNGKARLRDDEGSNPVEQPVIVNRAATAVMDDVTNGDDAKTQREEPLPANQSGPKALHQQDLDLDPDPAGVAVIDAAANTDAAVALNGPADPSGPFEGPEKLLELWFAPSPEALPEDAPEGLRSISRDEWDDMLDIVKCKVLSTLHKGECDAYLLSESSMFVFPHKMILKTCGTTTLLLGLERILHLAWKALYPKRASSSSDHTPRQLGGIVQRCFYSRKTFMFPERQKGPHRDWTRETEVLDSFLDNGSAYTVGKMNGDHWLLYSSASAEADKDLSSAAPSAPMRSIRSRPQDQTLEILMTHLSPESCERFYFPDAEEGDSKAGLDKGHRLGFELSDRIGLSTLFPATKLDAFGFEPCGYSANALMGAEAPTSAAAAAQAAATAASSGVEQAGRGEGPAYWTVHVTPEEGSSYASFETNINVADLASAVSPAGDANAVKDLPSLVRRIVDIFHPGRLSVTLFMSTSGMEEDEAEEQAKGQDGQVQKQLQQGDVLHALQLQGYRRTDRIAYEFEDYDLVFVSLDRVGFQG